MPTQILGHSPLAAMNKASRAAASAERRRWSASPSRSAGRARDAYAWPCCPTRRGPRLRDFTKATTEPGAIVHTDGLQSYRALVKHGYDHRRRPQQTAAPGEQLLPRAHRAISNLKAWMHGTHRGVSDEHVPVYLDEYVFRHNRRTSPMAAFQTLLGLGALHEPTTYRQIANHDRAA
jgi:transposase-like protein